MTQMNLETQWVPVGMSADLDPGTAFRAVVGASDLAVWRGADNKARVWENRCPHRGMRLSFGFVRDNLLTCLYHGWGYDGDGACAKIPAHPDLKPPKSITVNLYACSESGGVIWATQVDAPPAALAFQDDWSGCRSMEVNAPLAQIIKSLSGGGDLISGATITSVDVNEATVQIGVGDSDVSALLIALQPVSQTQTLLHVSARGAQQPLDMKRVNVMLKRLRATLESHASS